ncbi:PepSY domain-containing protein [Arenicella xantha]|uniref:PepSY-associated transmembrane protein n=1 Tax=Arenicella xantha TaxID=644221 RepID=A0A395JLY5_9GAMM|nr:PepSY domain-containing protein [Arenicella xantha]RBP50678.1 PepSY-associated transmembrane protein [Arenicella xantha]
MTLRFLHKWLGVVIGLQVIIWVVSGMLISFIDHKTVSGRLTRTPQDLPAIAQVKAPLFPIQKLIASAPTSQVSSVALTTFMQTLSYRLETPSGPLFYDATTGRPLTVSKQEVQQVAVQSYQGDGRLMSVEYLKSGSRDDNIKDAAWRANFDDDLATRVYISTADASVLAHRNRYWKVVDFLLMLHFMDYPRKHNFNNPQILIVAFLTLWLAISGVLLVMTTFTRRDFTRRGLVR